MPPLDELYGRLLLAYPEEYRERQGAEMVSTLLDVARPRQVLPSWRESLALVVGGLRTRAREAARQGPRALWWEGLRLGAAALIAGQAGSELQLSLGSGPYIRPHVLPMLLALTAIALLRRPERWGLTLIAVDAVAMWPAPLPVVSGGGLIVIAPSLLPFQSGPWPLVIGPWVCLAMAAAAFALTSPAARLRRPWSWWIIAPMLVWPVALQLVSERVPYSLLMLLGVAPYLVCLALGVLSVAAHDPRPGIAAAVYLVGSVAAQLPFIPFVFWSFGQAEDTLMPLLLLAVTAAAVVVSSRSRAHP